MSYGHMLLVREDAIGGAVPQDRTDDQLAIEVGRAVLSLCRGREREPDDEGGMTRRRKASVFNHGNGVEWAGERHTDEEDLFLWPGNCLQPITNVDINVLERVLARVNEMFDERRRRKAP